jgi:hypothetical protein
MLINLINLTGKTFLISLILETIRSQNGIALSLASSGIAATLLEVGRTAHFILKLPLNMQIIKHQLATFGEILRWPKCYSRAN